MKQFAKYLLLAQTASDAGKGFLSATSKNADNAKVKNYSLKDNYIRQAIAVIPSHAKVGVSSDNDMTVVLFDVQGYGQVSFHTFEKYDIGSKNSNVVWNGVFGGSILTCQKLAKRFNLPFYNHGKKRGV